MKRIAVLLILSVMAGCSGGAGGDLETARFEEKQGNIPHAIVLYEKVVREKPGSPEAKEASARLEALRK